MTLATSGSLTGRCPICGATGAVCGPTWHGTPVDVVAATKRGEDMALIKVQDEKGNTFQMTREDAERSGYTPVPEKTEPKAAASGGDRKPPKKT